ncbi:hypothetical protein Salat_1554000 [Sesamum alatum]|uniref:C2H2-type domain-containing protein n=1 Tax=Sesamum alatum TaxID=300844 RepID=A0AAE2CMR2_9LAMI|nr:hypothetical protein Salat_1554000 [Sesamum alatum]
MALSWSELSTDHKIVFLLEGLANKKDQHIPIACRLCDEIFFDNKKLVNHFQSHFHRDGTFNPRSLVRSSVSLQNGINLYPGPSQNIHSLSVPVDVCKSIANGHIGPRAWKNIPQNPARVMLGDSQVPTMSQDSIEMTGPTLMRGPRSYPSPSIFRSSISHDAFASPLNQSSNFRSRFASQTTTGPQNFDSTARPISPGVFTSQTTQISNFHFPMNPGTSASQPIQQSSFYSPNKGAFASESIPGTSCLAPGATTRCLPQTAMENQVEGPFTGYTKPYIMELEQPIEEMGGHNDVGGNSNLDEMDLTLKL